MTKSIGKVHYYLRKNVTDQLLHELVASGVHSVFMNPQNESFSLEEGKRISSIFHNQVDLFIVDDLDYAIGIGAAGLLLTNPNINVASIRERYPHLTLGGVAESVLACKNWELQGVDYIKLPINSATSTGATKSPILGSEILSQLIPKEQSYGWMIMSLITPVLVSGIRQISEVKELVAFADIHGLIIDNQFEVSLGLKDSVENISDILK